MHISELERNHFEEIRRLQTGTQPKRSQETQVWVERTKRTSIEQASVLDGRWGVHHISWEACNRVQQERELFLFCSPLLYLDFPFFPILLASPPPLLPSSTHLTL
eukprot:763327-Hanusia_phi.AAC.5